MMMIDDEGEGDMKRSESTSTVNVSLHEYRSSHCPKIRKNLPQTGSIPPKSSCSITLCFPKSDDRNKCLEEFSFFELDPDDYFVCRLCACLD